MASQQTDQEDIDWGAQGAQPPNGHQFTDDDENNPGEEEPAAATFNWLFYQFIDLKNDVAADISNILDGTLQVGDAESADVADSANAVDGEDVNGQVSAAAEADQAKRFDVRSDDPQDPADGQVWIRSDL